MDTSNRPLATKEDWERHKDEIERMLIQERKPLPEVMAEMAKRPDFPHASENMWKKQKRRWGFDVNNHKHSTIVAAVAHYSKCQNEGTPFYFAPPDCKPVTEDELMRYLKRRHLRIVNGQLVPKAAPPVKTAASKQRSICSPCEHYRPLKNGPTRVQPIIPLQPSNGFQEQPQEIIIDSQPLIIYRDSNVPSHIPPSDQRSAERLRRHQLHLHSARAAFLRGRQQYISPTTLAAPDAYRKPEAFLLAYEVCFMSSWNAGQWGFDESGEFIQTDWSANLKLDGFYFHDLFREAGRLAKSSEMRRARRLFFNALEGLNHALAICLPLALKNFVRAIRYTLDLGDFGYTKTILAYCSALFSSTDNKYPGLRQLFRSLCGLEERDLRNVLAQSYGLFADCLGKFSKDGVYDEIIKSRISMIQHDPQLNSKSKSDSLWALLAEVQKYPRHKVHLELQIVRCAVCDEVAPDGAAETLEIIETTIDNFMSSDKPIEAEEEVLQEIALLQRESSRLLMETGQTESAIEALQASLVTRLELGDIGNIQDFNVLRGWQMQLNNQQAALDLEEKYNRVVNGWVDLRIDDSTNDGAGKACDKYNLANTSRDSSSRNSCDTMDNEPSLSDYMDWDYYAQGENDTKAGSEKTQIAWRESVTAGRQEDLTLPVLQCSLEIDMQ